MAIIFGRDRAIGEGAKALVDVVENNEVEEATTKAVSEAYNVINVSEDDEGFFNKVNLENIQEYWLFQYLLAILEIVIHLLEQIEGLKFKVNHKWPRKTKDKERQ